MLVDFHLDEVFGPRIISGPDIRLPEPDAIEHAARLAVEAVGELLGIGKAAADPLDLALLAADIGGRAAMARRIHALDAHAVADVEASFRRRRVGARGHTAGESRLFCPPARRGRRGLSREGGSASLRWCAR